MNKVTTLLLQLLLALSPIVCFFIIKEQLPDSLPLHFNASMEADRLGDKDAFLKTLILLVGISIFTSVLLLNIDKIDPKKKLGEGNTIVRKLSWTFAVFIAFFALAIQYIAMHGNDGSAKKLIPIAVSILFIAIGNLMNSIKANYFIGFRTPWALESEDNWRKTNAVGSRSMFGAGMLMLIAILLLPAKYAAAIILPTVIIAAIIPIAYSYWYFKTTSKSL